MSKGLTGYATLPQFMTITDASAYFGVSKYFLRTGVKSGQIAHTVLGNKYMIDVFAFQRQLDSNVDFHTQKNRGDSFAL